MLDSIFRVALSLVLGCITFLLALIGIQANRLYTTEQGPFSISIEREAATAREEALITAAEAVCPTMAPHGELLAPVEATTDCQWWHRDYTGFRIPVAVTGEAWRYYQDEVGKMQQESESHDYDRVNSASLKYTATVQMPSDGLAEEFPDRVVLTLKWSYYCGGGFCGHGFNMKRVVYFDSAGNATFVLGDGEPSVSVY